MHDANISTRGVSAAASRCGFRSGHYFRGKNVSKKAFRTEISVRYLEFRGGRFSEVGNVWDFNLGPEDLSALESVSTSRSVRFEGVTVFHIF